MDHDPMTLSSDVNISDVIDVIRTTDPEFAVLAPSAYTDSAMDDGRRPFPRVEIVEQPAPKALRFRYECEGRSAGSIPGVNSTPENKTFPTIRVVGYKGRAVVVVSCVTKDEPHKPHPHNLVGKEGCKKGVCTVEMNTESMSYSFSNLGIQCVKKKDIEEALKVREEIRVDPFRTGFDHRKSTTSIDLNAVRLCFQVFIEGNEKGKFTVQLQPVVSDPIYDKKAMCDLLIHKLSHCSSSVAGGQEMILLCEKVAKEDIQVRFFEERNGEIVWEAFGDFQPTSVFKQVAICFRCPKYRSLNIEEPVKAYIQLYRPTDKVASEPLPFEFYPLDSDPKVKRKKTVHNLQSNTTIMPQPGESGVPRQILHGKHQAIGAISHPPESSHLMKQINPAESSHMTQIKCEPSSMPDECYADISHQQYQTYQTYRGINATPSPQASPSPHSQHGRTPSPMDYPQQNAAMYVHNPFIGVEMTQNIPLLPPENITVCHPVSGNRGFPVNNLNTGSGIPYNNNNPVLAAIGQSNLRPPIVRTTETYVSNPPYSNIVLQNIPACAPSVNQQVNFVNVNPFIDPNCPPTENSILDLDSQQCTSIGIGQMDSTEFVNFGLNDAALSENLSNNLSLSDEKPRGERPQRQQQETEQENMTDSFTTLTESIRQDIASINSMYDKNG